MAASRQSIYQINVNGNASGAVRAFRAVYAEMQKVDKYLRATAARSFSSKAASTLEAKATSLSARGAIAAMDVAGATDANRDRVALQKARTLASAVSSARLQAEKAAADNILRIRNSVEERAAAASKRRSQGYSGLLSGEGAQYAESVVKSLSAVETKLVATKSRLAKGLPAALAESINKARAQEIKAAKASVAEAKRVADEKHAIAVRLDEELARLLETQQTLEDRLQRPQYRGRSADVNALEAVKARVEKQKVLYNEAAVAAGRADTAAAKSAQSAALKIAREWKKAFKDSSAALSSFKNAFSSLGSVASNAYKAVKGFTSGMANSLRYASQGVQEVTRTLLYSVVAPIGYFFTRMFTEAANFEEAMIRVRKTTGMYEEGIKSLSDFIRSFALSTASSQSELALFAEQLGQVGVTGTNAIQRLVYLSEQLAISTDLSSNTVAESLGRIANAFGWNLNSEEGVANVESLADVINHLENTTAASAQNIVDGMLNVAGVGNLVGASANEIAVLTAYLENAGTKAEAAGTRLSTWYTQLIGKTDEFAQAMKGYKNTMGAELYNTGDDVRRQLQDDPVMTFVDALRALNTATDSDKQKALDAYFSVFGRVAGRTAVAQGSIDNLISTLEDVRANKLEGTLWQEYNRSLNSVNSHMKVLKNNITEAGLTLGDTFLPVINRLVEYAIPAIRMLIEQFNKLSDTQKMLVVGIPLLGIVLTPIIFLLSSIVHGFSLLAMSGVSAVGGVTSGVSGLFNTLLALFNLVSGVGKVAKGGGIFGGLTKILPTIARWLSRIKDLVLIAFAVIQGIGATPILAVVTAILSIAGAILSVIRVVNIFKRGVSDVKNTWDAFFSSQKGGAADVADAYIAAMDRVNKATSGSIFSGFVSNKNRFASDETIQRNLEARAKSAEDLALAMQKVNQAQAYFNRPTNVGYTGPSLEEIMQLGRNSGQALSMGINEGMSIGLKAIPSMLAGTMSSSITGASNVAMQAASIALTPLGNVITNSVMAGTSQIGSAFNKVASEIVRPFNKLAKAGTTWGSNLIKSFANGMILSGGQISKAMGRIFDRIVPVLKSHSPPVEGPLKNIDLWGKNVMTAFLQGFGLADFNILSNVAGKIKSAFDILVNLGKLSQDAMTKAYKAARENIAKVIDVFNKTGNVSESLINKIGNNLGSLGKDIRKLLRLWLEYEKIQKRIRELEKAKKATLKTYDDELAAIMAMNISAEEKAELIRQAMLKRDQELRQIEKEKKLQEEAAEAKKEELDWQEAFVDAQLESVEALNGIRDAMGGVGDAIEAIDFDGVASGINAIGDAEPIDMKWLTDLQKNIESAKKGIEFFLAAFRGEKIDLPWKSGKKRSVKLDEEDEAYYQANIALKPELLKEWKSMWELGLQAGQLWQQVSSSQLFTDIKALFSGSMSFTDFFQKLPDNLSKIFSGEESSADAESWGKNVGSAFGEGLGAAAPSIISGMAKGITDVITGWLKGNSPPAEGPLSDIDTWGAKIIQAFADGIPLAAGYLIGKLGELLAGVPAAFTSGLEAGWASVSAWFATKQASWGGFFGTLISGAALQLNTLPTLFSSALASAWTIVTTMWGSINKIWGSWWSTLVEGAGKIMGGLGGALGGAIKNAIPSVVSAAKSLVDKFWSVLQSLPGAAFDALKEWLGKNSKDKTPGFAKGGIVTTPMTAHVGEGGEAEAIIPLSKLPNIINSLYASQLSFAANGANSGMGGGVVIQINNPVVRDDQDIDKIARQVEKVIARRANTSMRMRGS